MTDKTDSTYLAQISLSLPGKGDATAIVVTLAPADKVPLGDGVKSLSDCTLAELAAYGQVLEADIWNAYEAITLLDLQESSTVAIHVSKLDHNGEVVNEVADWHDHAIILATYDETPEVTPILVNGDTEAKEERADATDTELKPKSAESTTAMTDEDDPPQIVMIKPSAKPAKLVKPDPAPKSDWEGEPSTIIPSQARVRVAGGRLPLAEAGGAAADILLDESPLRAMQAHALSSLDREVAGVLVGHQPEKQPDGRYIVHIIDSIVAKHTVMQGASVTYTPESWRYMTDTLWERYPDDSAVIVGWYHTHPGFGIFLSGMDLFIHQNFFTQPWHVAYVLDPRARNSGFFCWNRQRTKVNRYDFMWPGWASGSW